VRGVKRVAASSRPPVPTMPVYVFMLMLFCYFLFDWMIALLLLALKKAFSLPLFAPELAYGLQAQMLPQAVSNKCSFRIP